MLNPDHQIDLPQPYTAARGARAMWTGYMWFFLIMGVCFVVLFVLIDEFPLIFIVIALGYGSFALLRRCLVRRALVRYRGKVCPCCWHRSDDPKPGCRGCEQPAGRRAHRVYWRLMRLSIAGAEQWFGDRFRIENKPPPLTRIIICIIGIAIAIPVLIALYVVMLTVLYRDLSWIGGMSSQGLFWMLYFPALLVSGYFARRRIGKSLHCAKCEYQIAPVGPRPDNCPECGANLSATGAVSKGRQVGSRRGMAVPIVAFVLIGCLPLINLFSGLHLSPSTLVSTPLLIDHVVSQQKLDYDIERIIETRRLSDKDIERLLDEVENRLRNGSDFSPRSDPTYWGMNVGELIMAEFDQRKPPHKIALKLLGMQARYPDQLPYLLEVWVREAVQDAVYTQQELQQAGYLVP